MRRLYLLWIMVAFAVTSCYEDDSTLGTKVIPDIEIAKLGDTSVVSYSGQKLEISPEFTTDYPQESLSFAWYYYENNKNTDEVNESGYRKNRISEERNLSYEVNLPSGTYTFVFEVTSKENDYIRTQTMKVLVTTEFVGRFYVLKETKDGDSELDLVKGTSVSADLVTKMSGAPMAGAPVNMSYIFNQGYMDPEELQAKGTRAMYVFTEKECRVFNTEDMSELMNKNTLSYGSFGEEEVPCSSINALVLMLITNKGFYYTSPYDLSIGTTGIGKYGLSTGAGGSRFVVAMGFGMTGYVYWSESERHLYITDFNGASPTPLSYDMPSGVDENSLTCIASGQNYVGEVETNWFLTKAGTGDRYLYLLDNAQNVTEIRKLDASLHVAQADIVAAQGLKASVIYAVDENALWAYDWIHNSESRVPLPGIGPDETLAYVSNQYLQAINSMFGADNSYDFDNLIVGTQEGDTYKLYFYDDVVGAIPQKAVLPAVGKGKVRSVRFAAPIALDCFNLIMPVGPFFPLSD